MYWEGMYAPNYKAQHQEGLQLQEDIKKLLK